MHLHHIFLDLDGVLADFTSAACALHGKPDAVATWPPGAYECEAVLGITTDEFWAPITDAGAKFWRNLALYPWAMSLYEMLADAAPVTILSAPSDDPYCAAGKLQWLNQHLGTYRAHLTDQKHLLSGRGRILIDDRDAHIEDWRRRGGFGITFPRPWNRMHWYSGCPLEYVRAVLESTFPGAMNNAGQTYTPAFEGPIVGLGAVDCRTV